MWSSITCVRTYVRSEKSLFRARRYSVFSSVASSYAPRSQIDGNSSSAAAMVSPMSIPPGLKPVTMYVRRAEKLDNASQPEAPVVAYHTRLFATEQAMKLQDNTDEG